MAYPLYVRQSITKWEGILQKAKNKQEITTQVLMTQCGYCNKFFFRKTGCEECPLNPIYCAVRQSLFSKMCIEARKGRKQDSRKLAAMCGEMLEAVKREWRKAK